MLPLLFEETAQNYTYYKSFREGDEKALNYFYVQAFPLLKHYGIKLIEDEFTVESIVQECILKTWKYRSLMESMLHIYCFARLNVKWGCYSWLKSPAARFHRHLIRDGTVERYSDNVSFFDREEAARKYAFDGERLEAVYKVLSYLPPTRKTIMTLYFQYGMSYTQIAKRFSVSQQAITREVQQGLEHLKRIINAEKNLDVVVTDPSAGGRNHKVTWQSETLEGEMLEIFRMRYELKLPFDRIAEKMNLSLPYIQQQYIIAHKKLKEMKVVYYREDADDGAAVHDGMRETTGEGEVTDPEQEATGDRKKCWNRKEGYHAPEEEVIVLSEDNYPAAGGGRKQKDGYLFNKPGYLL
jgi:RNA polymerase sigma-70 factor (ECF subfamily)